jgi:hypothetical protein
MPSPFPGMDPYLEKRVYCSSDDESLLVSIPDVAVTTGRSTISKTGSTTIQPKRVTVPLAEEVTERYLEIHEAISPGD